MKGNNMPVKQKLKWVNLVQNPRTVSVEVQFFKRPLGDGKNQTHFSVWFLQITEGLL